jgi:hypothetical protein
MDDWKDKIVNNFPRILDHLHTVFPYSVAISMLSAAANSNSLQSQSCAAPSPSPLFPTINFSGICIKQVHFPVHDVLIEGTHSVLVACSCCTELLVEFDLRHELG